MTSIAQDAIAEEMKAPIPAWGKGKEQVMFELKSEGCEELNKEGRGMGNSAQMPYDKREHGILGKQEEF